MERLKELIGKTLTKVENNDNHKIVFTCEDGKQYERDQFNTNRYAKSCLEVEFTYDCEHLNEKLNQGDGFIYVTCADCGEDI